MTFEISHYQDEPDVSENMPDSLEVRESRQSDYAAIEKLYPDAFPDEDLLPLVKDLLKEVSVTLSLVGCIATSLVGHVVFTTCGLTGATKKAALLGPLGVASRWQKQGVGSAIVRAGLKQLENEEIFQVYVLGDPGYYGRFGFVPEFGVAPPYPLPEEWHGAWQSLNLGNAEPPRSGELSVPNVWRQPALWGP